MGNIFKKIILFFAWVLIIAAILAVLGLTGYIIYFLYRALFHHM